MKNLSISLFLILFASCAKEKTDQEYIIGSWQRVSMNCENKISNFDTVSFSKKEFTLEGRIYNYVLVNNEIVYYLKNSTDPQQLNIHVSMISEQNMKWLGNNKSGPCPIQYYQLLKISE